MSLHSILQPEVVGAALLILFPMLFAGFGSVLHDLKRFDEALASCDRALALRPQYADAHANRASALHMLKRFEEALACCDRAAALQPNLPKAHYNRGNALRMLGRFEEAVASYQRECAARPDFAEAHYNESAVPALDRRSSSRLGRARMAVADQGTRAGQAGLPATAVGEGKRSPVGPF